jgi:GDPmannose 4,6-dehydratase
MRTALITGITGQDGSYLAELLLEKGYRVVGVVRRSSTSYFERIGHILDRIELVSADLLDQHSLTDVVRDARPDEVYNLAAQSFVQTSWTQPVLTGEFTALGVTRMLEAMKKAAPEARFYQASSSEQFGKVQEVPQREDTPFYPRSPYGVAKVYGHWITVNYRESFGLYAVSGILFNHESPRRGLEFVTRKISDGVARIAAACARAAPRQPRRARDWGFAGDYVDAMWRMLQQDEPDDYVIGTGETWSVREFCELAFAPRGSTTASTWCRTSASSAPPRSTCSSATRRKAKRELGWEPEVGFAELVEMMVEADLERYRRQGHAPRVGAGRADVCRRRRALVTGAAGFVGRWLVARARADGWAVTGTRAGAPDGAPATRRCARPRGARRRARRRAPRRRRSTPRAPTRSSTWPASPTCRPPAPTRGSPPR